MNENKKDRNIGLDILKCIAAFLVICIHAPFQGKCGEYFVAIARCSVPIFFIITGFFYNNKMSDSKVNKQIFKIFKLCIISNTFYFIFKLLFCIIDNRGYLTLCMTTINKKALIKLFIFNESPIYSHLWYLNALLYVLIIMKFVNKYNVLKYIYMISPLLLLGDLIFGKYSLLLLNRELPFIFVRNFIFVGIPYFCIGNYINTDFYSKLKENRSKKYIFFNIVLILITMLTTILERYILVYLKLNASRDHYISTTFLAIALFICFLLYENSNKIIRIKAYIAKIGREYSTLIYIIHPAVIEILNRILGEIYFYKKIYPICIFIVTVSCCIVYKKIISLKTIVIKNEKIK